MVLHTREFQLTKIAENSEVFHGSEFLPFHTTGKCKIITAQLFTVG